MRILSIATLLLLVFAVAGCEKNQTPEQPGETVDPGLIKGMVFLYDQGTNFSDKSGMTVTLENSSPLISTVTDATGAFTLKVDTAIRAFTLAYTKPSYGTYKEFYTRSNDSLYVYGGNYADKQVKTFIGNGHNPAPNLGQKSTVVVNSLQASVVNGKVVLACNVAGDGYVQIFYQKNAPITSFSTIPKGTKNVTGIVPVKNGNNVLDSNANLFLSSPNLGDVRSGETVYMTAYGNAYFSGAYLDRATNQFILPNVNLTANVTPISFVMP